MMRDMQKRAGWVVLFLTCACLFTRADTLIGVGETLAVTNTEDLGFSTIQMSAGSSLVFLGASASSPGLNEYTRTNTAILGTPGVTAYGTWTRVTTNAAYASDAITAQNTEYIYTGRWHIPAEGTYSFYENIDDAACLSVDGTRVLFDTVWNSESRKQDVAMKEGWHDLEIRVRNGSAGGGPFYANLRSGLLFSPVNDVIATNNQDNAYPFADSGDGSVLQTVHNGHLFQKVLVDGEVTFDLSGQGLDVPLAVTGSLWPQSGAAAAKITVEGGSGEILFGSAGADSNFLPFNVDVAFSGVADPAGVTFRDRSTVVASPTSCVWRVADGAVIALAGTNNLGVGDVVLTNHSIYVLTKTAVANDATIRVQGTNLTASIKPCTIDASGVWWGFPATYTNDIALEGENATVTFPLNSNFYLQGAISGTGTVVKTGSARAEILEGSDFVGTVLCSQGTLVFDSVSAGHSNNTVTVGANATLALYPPGYGATETVTWMKRLEGSSASGKVYLPVKQTLVVDTLEGTLGVEGGNASSSVLHINTLGSNAVISLIKNVTVEVDHIEPGASINLADESTSLAVTGTGNTLGKLTLASGEIAVSGAFTVSELTGSGTLVKSGDALLDIQFSTLTGGIRIGAGTVRCVTDLLPTNSVLNTLPALWLDASAENVFTQYKTYTFTNGFMVIERWNDCRAGAPGYFYQDRGQDQWQTYPYVMTNNQNGLSVVSFGSYQTTLPPAYESRLEARRGFLNPILTPRTVVMVFGSQNGGGAAAIGVKTGTNAFARGGASAADYRNPATPILLNGGYACWTNGLSVGATGTGMSGGYQLLSVSTVGQPVGALGWSTSYQNAGGQNYGEVLMYTNDLTTLQRVSVEAYLAKKWNLPYVAVRLAEVAVAAGATLEVGGSCTVSNVTGIGRVIVSGSATVSLSSLFAGSIEMAGGELALSDMPDVPDQTVVPADNLAVWFDPCQTNRIVFGSEVTPERPLAVAGLYDRTTDSRYLLGTCGTDLLTAVDRRPWLAVTNGPLGKTQYWIDFANNYGDTRGNTLRLNTNPSYIGTQTTMQVPTNVQSGFIVLDSSRGGGVPITYDVSATQVITRDNPQSVTSAVWGAGTTTSLKSGATYLDGKPINGATHGYSGTTELLSFVATNIFQAAYFGYYGGDNVATPNRERLGEIILFDTVLDDGTRADIEAYLMKKWLGKARSGYADMTEATVSGSGAVQAVRPSQLPAFDAGFAGSVALSGTAFDYTLTTNALGEYVMLPASAIPGTLSVAAAGTLTVNFAVKPSAGTYTVITYGAITGNGFANWTLNTTGSKPVGTVFLKATDTVLNLAVSSPGTLILVN